MANHQPDMGRKIIEQMRAMARGNSDAIEVFAKIFESVPRGRDSVAFEADGRDELSWPKCLDCS
ncbi:MAG: hypothetical protein EBZ48_09180 [Proteobacteria bacterium]|nr:hypothetical protein [Pseudomonadota bacterium]